MILTVADWKKFYEIDRLRHKQLIRDSSVSFEKDSADNSEISDFVATDGVISVPHTFLDVSLNTLISTASAIYHTDKTRVIALGVLHGIGSNAHKEEFSLDNLVYVIGAYGRANHLPKVYIKKIYPVQKPAGMNTNNYIQLLVEQGLSLRTKVKDAVIVTTGDLVHYGACYSTPENEISRTGFEQCINAHVDAGLKMVYVDKDFERFIATQRTFNDQLAVAIVVSSFLGDNLEVRKFSTEFADYSKILKAPQPTIVASVHYGANKR